MAGLGIQLLLKLKADASQAINEMKGLDDAQAKIGEGAKRAAMIGGAAIGMMAVQGVREFATLDTGMREVFTLMPGMSQGAMDAMTEDVKGFAQEYGMTTETVVPALYQAISAGIPPDNVMTFMETAAKNARGGCSDLATSVDGITSVVNAYGSEVLDAATASDIMFTGVRMGKTTIGELSQSMFQVAPAAASMGVGLDQVVSAMATMTISGVPTQVAANNLKQALLELGKEGSVAFLAFEEATGTTFPAFIAGGGTIGEAFGLMGADAEANGSTIAQSFGSIEAGLAATILASDSGSATFSTNMGEMAKSTGATDAAFQTMAGGVGFSFDQMKAKGEAVMLTIGEALMPAFEMLLPVIEDLIGPLGQLITPLVGAFMPVIKLLVPLFGALVPLIEGAAVVFESLTPVIGMVVAVAIELIKPVTQLIEGLGAIYNAALGPIGPIDDLTTAATNLDTALMTGQGIGEARAALIDLGVNSGAADAYILRFKGSMEGLQMTAGMVEGAIGAVDTVFGSLTGQAKTTNDTLATTKGAFGLLKGVVGQMPSVTSIASTAMGIYTTEMDKQEAAIKAVYDAEKALVDARRAAVDPVFAAIQASRDYEQAIEDLAEMEGKGVTSGEDYEDASIAKMNALLDMDAAAAGVDFTTTREELIALGERAGLTSEQMKPMLDRLDLMEEARPPTLDFKWMFSNLTQGQSWDWGSLTRWEQLNPKNMILRWMYQFGGGRPPPAGTGVNWSTGEQGGFAGGGWGTGDYTTVGEHGPEVVKLPAGSQILPNGSGPSGGGGTTVVVNVAGSVVTEQQLADILERRLVSVWQRGGRSQVLL